MRFIVLRILNHSELGMFHEYRRQKLEGSKQRSINFDSPVVDRIFPAYKDDQQIPILCRYHEDADKISTRSQWLTKQDKNWRLEGNCPKSTHYAFVRPGCLFAMEIDAEHKPATAVWIVIPEGHPAHIAICASAESANLSSASMIELHGREGDDTISILRQHFPSLFNTEPQTMSDATRTTAGTDEINPDPLGLYDLLASVGHDLRSAVADLVDNSISAGATDIRILFPDPNDGGRRLAIIDDGKGMTPDELRKAMQVAGRRNYEPDDLGRYGFGLKGASFSQGDRLVVVTRTKGCDSSHHLMWDRKILENNQSWAPQCEPLSGWEKEAASFVGPGTAIILNRMSPPTDFKPLPNITLYESEVITIRRHLELIFHRFLEGEARGKPRIRITINNMEELKPNNPVIHPSSYYYDAKTFTVPYQDRNSGSSGQGRITVQPVIIPRKSELEELYRVDSIHLHDPKRWSMYGRYNESQGLYVYRQDRLIRYGWWPDRGQEPHISYLRVVLDFERVLDQALRVNVSKNEVQLPLVVNKDMEPLLEIARREANRRYREENPKRTSKKGRIADGTSGTLPTTMTNPTSSGQPMGSAQVTPLASPPKVEVRTVKELPGERFWEIGASFNVDSKIQVSMAKVPALASLADAIESADKPRARASLADFLRLLDSVNVQKLLAEATRDNFLR